MDIYIVEPDGQGGFQVVTLHPSGKRENVTGGYVTEAAAEAWIAARRELAQRKEQAAEDAGRRQFYNWDR
jgi:hypothetical protein